MNPKTEKDTEYLFDLRAGVQRNSKSFAVVLFLLPGLEHGQEEEQTQRKEKQRKR